MSQSHDTRNKPAAPALIAHTLTNGHTIIFRFNLEDYERLLTVVTNLVITAEARPKEDWLHAYDWHDAADLSEEIRMLAFEAGVIG